MEEAISIALEKLKVNREDLEIDVISEGSHGIFGLGAEEACITVSFKENQPQKAGLCAEDAITITTDIVQNLVDRMGLDADVEYLPDAMLTEESENESGMVFDILGEDLGLLIGRHGQTLSNFQYLVRILVAQRIKEYLPILVDVNGYRQRRFKALEVMARRTAEQVRIKRMPFSMEPMPAFERRIIHMVLAGDPAVTTQSTGVGDDRKVVVVLREGNSK
ncbi:MAG: RNA-binding cell elongation regulator Jag/EloR [Dehalogenimonas sp.]